jgi:pimeloyl-ACP methyl ester carboxylesterase
MPLACCAVCRFSLAVLCLATFSACSPDSETAAGTWIGFAQMDDWEAFLELRITESPDSSVRVVRMWPGQPGAQAHLKILGSGIQFELESPAGIARFDGHQEGSVLDGTLELAESQGRFSLRRMIASYFLFDDSGRYRRLYPVAADAFVAAEAVSDSGPFFSEIGFAREADGDAGGLRWQLHGEPAISGARRTVYRQEEVTIESESARLEGRLLLPSEPGPNPAVVVLHGLGAFSRNMAGPFLIADYLASRGIAVLIYDKRGVGGSTGGHPVNSRVSEYAGDAVLGAEYLAGRTEIDPGRIGLLGVSDGARTAAVAGGQSEQIAFLVLVSGRGISVAESWPPDEVVDNLSSQLRARGFEEEAIQNAARLSELDLAYSLQGEGWDELEDAIAIYRDEPWFGMTQLGWVEADTRGHRYWSRYNPPAEDDPQLALRTLRVPILAIWGEMDPTFPPRVHKPGLEELLAEAGHPDYTLVEYSNAGHGLEDIPPGKPLRTRGLTEGYFETVGEWLKERFDR